MSTTPRSVTVELLTLGNELLDGRRIDTNASWIGRYLAAMGVQVRYRQTTLDDKKDIAHAFQAAINRVDVVVSTGGLGPTQDDLTFEALADACQRPLVYHEEIEKKAKERYAIRNVAYVDSNRRQAMLPEGAEPIPNENGTAPGCFLTHQGKMIFCFPGVPKEMQPMVTGFFTQKLLKQFHISPHVQRTFSTVGIAEAHVERIIQESGLDQSKSGRLHVAYTASSGFVDVTFGLFGENAEIANRELDEIEKQFRDLFENHLIGWDQKRIEEHLLDSFVENKWTLSMAESLTGGMISSALVEVPGSSAYFLEGLTTYSNEAKIRNLGVKSDTLNRFGAVSFLCAREMAEGIRQRAGSTFSVAATGIAGPAGGSPAKPVGLTYLAFAGPLLEKQNPSEGTYVKSTDFVKINRPLRQKKDMNVSWMENHVFQTKNGFVQVQGFVFPGDRKRIRALATNHALLGLYSFIKNYQQ